MEYMNFVRLNSVAIVLALHTTPATAFDGENQEIVITATKKAQSEALADIPVAITHFDTETLNKLHLQDLGNLSFSVPNVSLDSVGTTRGVANFAIRGLGINSGIPSIEPAVGVFIDGIYLGTNNGVSLDLADIANIDVLRGPQGILFGRNTTGGAVLVNTADPDGVTAFRARIGYEGPVDKGRGSGSLSLQSSLTGPLFADVISARIAVRYVRDRGYFRNLFDGRDFGSAETLIMRGGLELKPTQGVRMVLKGERLTSTGDGPASQNHGIWARGGFDFAINHRGLHAVRSHLVSWKSDIDAGEGKVTNIFGYRDYRGDTDADIDSTVFTLFHSPTRLRQRQWSNELRYAVRLGSADLTAGSYWFDQEIGYDEIRYIGVNSFYGGGRQKQSTLGLFAAASVAITPALTFNTGFRWSEEGKSARITYVRPRAACSVIEGSCPVTGTNPLSATENNGFADARRWGSFTPHLGLQYHIDAYFDAYAGWTRGVRSGGYNLRITQPAAFEAIAAKNGSFAFDPERVDSFEVGFKYSGQKLFINTAFFRMEVNDLQREISQSSGVSGIAQSIYNTADARIQGLEFEGRWNLSKGVQLSAHGGLLGAKYRRVTFDISGDGIINAADLALALPRAPRISWGGSIEQRWETGAIGSISTRVSFDHRSRAAYTDNGYGWLRSADRLDAHLAWTPSARWLTLSLYGRNLLDAVSHGGDTQIPFGGILSDRTNKPFDLYPAAGTFSPLGKGRAIGLELSIDF